MRSPLALVVLCVASGSAFAQQRFVERTPQIRHPIPHTMERAGCPQNVKAHSFPSVPDNTTGGYVGGHRLRHNNIFAKGHYVAPGALAAGTYGTDYAGIAIRPGRVFLAPSYDPSIGPTIANAYRTDGPQVKDVFSIRPLRNAILEKREDAHKGGEGHAPGNGGHAPEHE